jgi:phosphatidylserine/phosphatidylglycerophosphate/cardiolipin synthase-like enzyme
VRRTRAPATRRARSGRASSNARPWWLLVLSFAIWLAAGVAAAAPPPPLPTLAARPTRPTSVVVDKGPGTRAATEAPPPALSLPKRIVLTVKSPVARQLVAAAFADVPRAAVRVVRQHVVGSHGAAAQIEDLSDEELARMTAPELAALVAPVIHANPFQRITPEQRQRLSSAFLRVVDAAAGESSGKFEAVLANLRLTPHLGLEKLGRIGVRSEIEERIFVNRIERGNLREFDERLGQMGMKEGDGTVRVLVDGAAAFGDLHQTLTTALEAAKKTGKPGFVLVSTFAFQSDATGMRVAADLKALAAAGFKVHVLYDRFGSKMSKGTWSDPKFYEDLRANGVDVQAKRPGALYMHNTHMKPIEIGYHTSEGPKLVEYNGDMNIGDEYRVDWHGSMTRLEGPATKATLEAMVGQMKSNGVAITQDEEATFGKFADAQVKTPGMTPIWTVHHEGPADLYNKAAILSMIDVAPRGGHVFVEQPYVFDPDLFGTLERAAREGVNVHLIVPQHNDGKGVALGTRVEYGKLLDAGVHVYEYNDPRFTNPEGFSHLKRIVVLDEKGEGIISEDGSSNGDAQSFYHNDELVHIMSTASVGDPEVRRSTSQAIKTIASDVFLKDIESSKVITADDVEKPGLHAAIDALRTSWRVSGWIE